MLYVIYGTDTEKAREKSRALFEALKGKKPGAAAGILTAEDVTEDKLLELTQSQGLFENKQIIFMDRVLENKNTWDIVLEKIDAVADSPNIFIFFEGKLTRDILKKLEKEAEKVQEYVLDEETPAEKSNFFPLADALGSRDKKKLWILFRDAMDGDAVPEEIHGILWWQAKSLALASKTRNASEAGLNPFVYNKAKRYLSNWKKEEVESLLSKLSRMYHKAHRGEADFEIELEKLMLDI
ncbi:MAG: hypothetical protein AAB775_00875 [Patescibacteria group bacterium]